MTLGYSTGEVYEDALDEIARTRVAGTMKPRKPMEGDEHWPKGLRNKDLDTQYEYLKEQELKMEDRNKSPMMKDSEDAYPDDMKLLNKEREALKKGTTKVAAEPNLDLEGSVLAVPALFAKKDEEGISIEGMRRSENVEDRTKEGEKRDEEFEIAVVKEDIKTIEAHAKKYGFAYVYNRLVNKINEQGDDVVIPKSVMRYVDKVLGPQYDKGGLRRIGTETTLMEQKWLNNPVQPTEPLSREAGYYDIPDVVETRKAIIGDLERFPMPKARPKSKR